MDELPADVIGVIVAADPVAFLGVSKTARSAALAAISSRIVVVKPGTAKYGDAIIYTKAEHDCTRFDILLNGYSVCDICITSHTRCTECDTTAPPYSWLSYPVKPTGLHYREMVLIIIAAARDYRKLPTGFGDM